MAYVVFDTETTGLSPETGDRIIEIAAVRVVNGELTQDVFHALINPQRSIPQESLVIHGITPEMLSDAATAETVIPKFLDYVGSDILVAHNAEFDLAFLKAEMQKMGLQKSLNSSMCTVELAKQKLPQLSRYNLDALCIHFGLQIENRHRALDDVKATAEIFLQLHDEAPTLF